MKAKQIRLIVTITLFTCTGAAFGSPSSVEFESILLATDCVNVTSKRMLDLRVLGRTFPIANGYDFYGFDRGYAVFGMYPESDPLDNLNKYPNPSSLASAVRKWSASTASIYYASERDEHTVPERSRGFEALDWHGLTLYFRSKVGGSAVTSTIYQVVVHANGHTDELSIRAGSPQLIADIIACAKEVDDD